jgi:hypothetical protein
LVVAVEIWLWTLCTCVLMLFACDCTWVDTLETWLWTLLACDWMLSIALFTFPELLSSPPQPATATPAPTPKTAMASTAAMLDALGATDLDLLDCCSMDALLLPGSVGASRLYGPY